MPTTARLRPPHFFPPAPLQEKPSRLRQLRRLHHSTGHLVIVLALRLPSILLPACPSIKMAEMSARLDVMIQIQLGGVFLT
ncbi:hypothetical protein ASPZODRAFT_129641, partial [Penicilliopsis zonata CBS 506.65]